MKRRAALILSVFLLASLGVACHRPRLQEPGTGTTPGTSTTVTEKTRRTSLPRVTDTPPVSREEGTSPTETGAASRPPPTSRTSAVTTTAPPVTEAFFEDDFEKQVLALVNVERKKAGLNPLTASPGLKEAARVRAVELIQLFDHERPDGSLYSTAVSIPYLAVGENAALGQSSPQEVMRGWMESKGHRENLLHPEWTHLGVGCRHDSGQPGSYFWIQLFALIPSSEQYHKEAYDQEVVRLINEERSDRDLPPLILTEGLHLFAKDQAVHFSKHKKLLDLPGGLRTAFNTVVSGSAGEHAFDTPGKIAARLQALYGEHLFSRDYTQIGVGYYHSWQEDGIHWWGIVLGTPLD